MGSWCNGNSRDFYSLRWGFKSSRAHLMSSNPEHMRVYMAQRYRDRRALAIKELGGVCVGCGTKEDLQVDHVDRTKKTMKFARMVSCGLPRFMDELAKCQLLCQECHTKKTVESDLGRQLRTHGTAAMYLSGKCRCDACREANRLKYGKLARKLRAANLKGER